MAAWGAPCAASDPPAIVAAPSLIGSRVEIKLIQGDVIRGYVTAVDGQRLTIDHPDLGELSLGLERIATLHLVLPPTEDGQPVPPVPFELPAGVMMPVEPTATDVINEAVVEAVVPPAPEEPPAPPASEPPLPSQAGVWDRRLEFGLSGSSGNADRTTLRFAFDGAWTKPDQILRFNALYLLNINSGDRTQNRFESTARNEWIKAGTRWRIFLEGGFEFDEFRDFDARARVGGGVAYKFIMNETTDLLGRAGVGTSMEFGGPNDGELNPELIFGLELTHKLNDVQRIVASADLFPSLRDTGEYRAVLRGAWELRVDAERRMSLRIGAENRYDSMSDNARKNDLEYFASLVWSF